MTNDSVEAVDPELELRAARTLGDHRNFTGAVAALRRLLGRTPDFAPAHAFLGLYLDYLGDRAGAERECRAAVALDPSDAAAHRLLGLVIGRVPRHRKAALVHVRQAVALGPEDPYNHYNLARLLHLMNRRREAVASFAAACERAPLNATLLAGSAEALLALGRRREAVTLAGRAFAVAPDDPSALAAEARMRLLAGRGADARDLARAAVALDATDERALAVMIEAEMCRNPVFAVWSRVRSAMSGRWRLRLSTVMVVYFFTLPYLFAAAALASPLAAAGFVLTSLVVFAWAGVSRFVFRRRLAAAVRPVTLRRRF